MRLLISLFLPWRVLLILATFIAVLLTGCAEPKVRGSLVRQPSSRIERLIIDTTKAYAPNFSTNLWAKVQHDGFDESVPKVFATYGVQAILAKLDGEAQTLARNPGDYVLVVLYKSGFAGSSGNAAFFTLNLNDANGRQVWTGNTAVSGTGTILTKNLGEIVANNIAKALAIDELIVASGAIDATSALATLAPVLPDKPYPGSVLSVQQQSAFDLFKGMDGPKSFVIADGGVFFTASGKSPAESSPSLRSLTACEDSKATNCHVFSDGFRVFDQGLPAMQPDEKPAKDATTLAGTDKIIRRPVLSGKLRDAWKDFQSKPYTRVFVLAKDEHWYAVWGRQTGLSAMMIDDVLDKCKQRGYEDCRVYAVNANVVWSRTDLRGGY